MPLYRGIPILACLLAFSLIAEPARGVWPSGSNPSRLLRFPGSSVMEEQALVGAAIVA